ncbi:hypothetical protein BCR35DRAFT_334797 [Leucosporidium creatinivorum]|uniref:Uncharacterized protein n=1 Tax=Leucosporidium creatinivorum TaxID=106004 RepID=A0A1Y2DWQ7_9BASI|nr:hypothetical protein BCR35DRAFT_334797 [Leucosporidium creatinivorum]
MSSTEGSAAAVASGVVDGMNALFGDSSDASAVSEAATTATSDEETASATPRSQQVLPTDVVVPDSSATTNSTTVDEDRVGQPMQGSSDAEETVIVHSDSSLEYGCPQNGTWSHSQVLSGSLTASTVDGAGCYVSFTFTGDSVQMFGATGPKAGVFGCSTSSDIWQAVGWWSAFGTTPYFASYQGSCTIAGLGFGKHTITMTNSPSELHLLPRFSAVTWAAPEWSGCCPVYTFPDGAATTVEPSSGSTESASPTATTTASTSTVSPAATSYEWKSILGVSLAALGIVALASLAMCCKTRGKKKSGDLSSLAKEMDPERSDSE